MKNILTKKSYILYKKYYSSELIDKIKKELTVSPQAHPDFKIETEYSVYFETKDKLYIPPFYGIKKIGNPDKICIKTYSTFNCKFNGQLRDYQLPVVDTLMNVFKSDGGGILSVRCGFGKTFVALYLACKLGYKTMILVHQDFFLKQWKDEINQFIPDARIGIIQGTTIDVENKDFVIGTFQSLCKDKYPDEIFQHTFLIVDECHHGSARTFIKAIMKCKSKYTLGLSATPKRKDGLTKVYKWFLGDIAYKSQTSNNFDVSIKCIKVYTGLPVLTFGRNVNGRYKKVMNHAKMMTDLVEHTERNETILNELIHICKTGRQILFISERRDMLSRFKKLIDDMKLITQDGELVKTGEYVGGSTEQTRKNALTSNIIFATYQYANEGMNIKTLNTLILATPIGDIEQSVGRILREKHPKFNKLVIDIIDTHGSYLKRYEKRRNFYLKEKYQIINDPLLEIEEEEELNNEQQEKSLFSDSD